MLSKQKRRIKKEDFAPNNYVDQKFDVREVKQIREVFETFDVNNDGLVSILEITKLLESSGFDHQNQVLFQLFKTIPNEEKYTLDFEEFLGMMGHRISENNSKEEIKEIFGFLTINKSEELNFDALKLIVRELGEDIAEAELREMIMKADLDQDGKVSFEDFYDLMMQKTFT